MKARLKLLMRNFINKNEEAINAIEHESKKRLDNIYKEDFKNKWIQTNMTLGIESSSFQEKCIQASTFAFSRHIQTDNEVTYLAPSTKSEKEAKSRKFSSIESEKYDAIELGSNNDAINDDVSSDG